MCSHAAQKKVGSSQLRGFGTARVLSDPQLGQLGGVRASSDMRMTVTRILTTNNQGYTVYQRHTQRRPIASRFCAPEPIVAERIQVKTSGAEVISEIEARAIGYIERGLPSSRSAAMPSMTYG